MLKRRKTKRVGSGTVAETCADLADTDTPIAQTHDYAKALKDALIHVSKVANRLRDQVGDMKSTNPRMHEIKIFTKLRWQSASEEALAELERLQHSIEAVCQEV